MRVLKVFVTQGLIRWSFHVLLIQGQKSHGLKTLTKKYNIELTQHHRAIYDTEATGELFLHLLKQAD